MTHVVRTIEVPVTPERAFDYVADFSTTEEWDPGIASARRLDGETVGVGSRFAVTAAFGDRELPLVYEITAYERPRRVVLVGTGGVFRGVDEIVVEPAGDGTRIRYTADLTLTGFARLIQPFLGRRFREMGDRAMAGLRAALGA